MDSISAPGYMPSIAFSTLPLPENITMARNFATAALVFSAVMVNASNDDGADPHAAASGGANC
jgi:hypothetical protein